MTARETRKFVKKVWPKAKLKRYCDSTSVFYIFGFGITTASTNRDTSWKMAAEIIMKQTLTRLEL